MTRDEMQTMVLDRLSLTTAETAKVTQVLSLLNLFHKDVVLRHRLNVAFDTLDVVADTATVALPSDLAAILSLSYSGRPVDQVTWQQYADLFSAAEDESLSEEGTFYYMRATPTTIRILPLPSASVTDAIDCWYCARPSDFANGSATTTLIPAEFHDILVEYTIHRLALAEEEAGLAQASLSVALGREAQLRTWLAGFEGGDNNLLARPGAFRR